MLTLFHILLISWHIPWLYLCTAYPIQQSLSADSISIFDDRHHQYPGIYDALHSLCRNNAAERRTYELDLYYRIEGLERVIGRNIEDVCGKVVPFQCIQYFQDSSYLLAEWASRIRLRLPEIKNKKNSKIIQIGTGSP
jgi:hypothetical protein